VFESGVYMGQFFWNFHQHGAARNEALPICIAVVSNHNQASLSSTTPSQIILYFNLMMETNFDEDLLNSSTDAFRILATKISVSIDTIFKDTAGYEGIDVRSFRSGSTIANMMITYSSGMSHDVAKTDFLDKMKSAIDAGQFEDINVKSIISATADLQLSKTTLQYGKVTVPDGITNSILITKVNQSFSATRIPPIFSKSYAAMKIPSHSTGKWFLQSTVSVTKPEEKIGQTVSFPLSSTYEDFVAKQPVSISKETSQESKSVISSYSSYQNQDLRANIDTVSSSGQKHISSNLESSIIINQEWHGLSNDSKALISDSRVTFGTSHVFRTPSSTEIVKESNKDDTKKSLISTIDTTSLLSMISKTEKSTHKIATTAVQSKDKGFEIKTVSNITASTISFPIQLSKIEGLKPQSSASLIVKQQSDIRENEIVSRVFVSTNFIEYSNVILEEAPSIEVEVTSSLKKPSKVSTIPGHSSRKLPAEMKSSDYFDAVKNPSQTTRNTLLERLTSSNWGSQTRKSSKSDEKESERNNNSMPSDASIFSHKVEGKKLNSASMSTNRKDQRSLESRTVAFESSLVFNSGIKFNEMYSQTMYHTPLHHLSSQDNKSGQLGSVRKDQSLHKENYISTGLSALKNEKESEHILKSTTNSFRLKVEATQELLESNVYDRKVTKRLHISNEMTVDNGQSIFMDQGTYVTPSLRFSTDHAMMTKDTLPLGGFVSVGSISSLESQLIEKQNKSNLKGIESVKAASFSVELINAVESMKDDLIDEKDDHATVKINVTEKEAALKSIIQTSRAVEIISKSSEKSITYQKSQSSVFENKINFGKSINNDSIKVSRVQELKTNSHYILNNKSRQFQPSISEEYYRFQYSSTSKNIQLSDYNLDKNRVTEAVTKRINSFESKPATIRISQSQSDSIRKVEAKDDSPTQVKLVAGTVLHTNRSNETKTVWNRDGKRI
jgi:hypothetical protein